MPVTTLPLIVAKTLTVVEALTPAQVVDVRFRRAPARVQLRQLSGQAAFRRFAVRRRGPRVDEGAANPWQVSREIAVEIAYPAELVGLYGLEDLDDLGDMLEADARQIRDAITSPANLESAAHRASYARVGRVERNPSSWIQIVQVEVKYDTAY